MPVGRSDGHLADAPGPVNWRLPDDGAPPHEFGVQRIDIVDVPISKITGKQLADKSWYPDVTLKAGAIDRTGNGPNGYMAEIGFRVPLQWGLHEAQQREATAQVGAAQARRQALELQIQSELGEFVADLAGSRKTGDLIRTQLLPQSQALLRSGVAGYGLGRAELVDVLRAEHDLADQRIELLSAEFDQQRQLAAIERLIGGDL